MCRQPVENWDFIIKTAFYSTFPKIARKRYGLGTQIPQYSEKHLFATFWYPGQLWVMSGHWLMTLLLKSCMSNFASHEWELYIEGIEALGGHGFARLRFFGLPDWLTHFKSQICLHDSILTQLTCVRVSGGSSIEADKALPHPQSPRSNTLQYFYHQYSKMRCIVKENNILKSKHIFLFRNFEF